MNHTKIWWWTQKSHLHMYRPLCFSCCTTGDKLGIAEWSDDDYNKLTNKNYNMLYIFAI